MHVCDEGAACIAGAQGGGDALEVQLACRVERPFHVAKDADVLCCECDELIVADVACEVERLLVEDRGTLKVLLHMTDCCGRVQGTGGITQVPGAVRDLEAQVRQVLANVQHSRLATRPRLTAQCDDRIGNGPELQGGAVDVCVRERSRVPVGGALDLGRAVELRLQRGCGFRAREHAQLLRMTNPLISGVPGAARPASRTRERSSPAWMRARATPPSTTAGRGPRSVTT